MAEEGAVCGVDVRGSAPGTRETEMLHPTAMVPHVHAICLSGGSAFGLEAAHGVMRYLREHGIGLDVGVGRVPIVPGAILFDLAIGRPGRRRPPWAMPQRRLPPRLLRRKATPALAWERRSASMRGRNGP